MKKFALLLAALLLMTTVFAACGESKDAASGTSQPGGAASSSEAAGEESAQPADTGDGDNTLVMATNAFFEPYEYYEGDDIVGIDAEVGKAIADKLGMDFEISDVDFDAIIPNVQSGKASMGMAGMTVTEDRQKNVNFTRSYATAVQVVIVPEGSDIAAIDDMAGKKIGVQQGTTGDIYCSAPVEEDGFGEENVTRYNKGTDAVMALLSGKVDCVVIDNEPAKAFVSEVGGLKILETEYITEDYAAAMSKENKELYEAVNTALQELIADGTVQGIIDKYITAE